MEYLNEIRGFITENFLFGDGSRLQDDTSFLESGIIDSTGILELVSFLEETFRIKVEDEELVPENMDNLTSLAEFIRRKLDGRSGATL